MSPAVRLALAVLQEQRDQPVPVVLAGTTTDHDVGLIGIEGLRVKKSFGEPQPDRSALLPASPHPLAERFLPRGRGLLVARPGRGGAQLDCLPVDVCGETQCGGVQAGHVWRAGLRVSVTGIARIGGCQVVVGVRLQHHASGSEAAQRVAVDGVLAGELLVVTAEPQPPPFSPGVSASRARCVRFPCTRMQ